MSDKQKRLREESALAMAERTIRRCFTLMIIIVLLWGLTVGGFVWYLNQYDFESISYQQDGAGLNFVGGAWTGVSVHNGPESHN